MKSSRRTVKIPQTKYAKHQQALRYLYNHIVKLQILQIRACHSNALPIAEKIL
jgi:hypothetical protein